MTAFKVKHVRLSGREDESIPSIIAVNRNDGTASFGYDAISSQLADSKSIDLLIDWKLFVGKSSEIINSEAARNPAFARVLSKYGGSFQGLLDKYIEYILKSVDKLSLETKPQMIVGIPVTTDFETSQWRRRYKEQISRSFKLNDYPEPKFFPEPFATFQYHWNRSDIYDSGEHQNVLVIDIGGGTTNICVIQTTKHGLLARGGGNKIPHAVNSLMVGGAQLDEFLYDKLKAGLVDYSHPEAILMIRRGKEQISKELNKYDPSDYMDDLDIKEIIYSKDNNKVTLDYPCIRDVFVNKLWPSIKDAVNSSLDSLKSKKMRNPVDNIDLVILSGGTCQLGLVEYMFKKEIALDNSLFSKTEYLVSDVYSRAVSDGLALEALANCHHHDIKPTRTSAYLNEDIVFGISHDKNKVGIPNKFKHKSGPCESDVKRGAILSSPQDISVLIGENLRWDFRLKQKSHDLYYSFTRVEPHTDDVIENLSLGIRHIRVGKKSDEITTKCSLRSVIEEDGFLKGFIDVNRASAQNDGALSEEIEPVDLHDLKGVIGSSFIGLDLGTNSTLCSYINADEDMLYEVMPEKYWANKSVTERSYIIISSFNKELDLNRVDKINLIKKCNENLIKDYVYHSNRIEGSELNRGQTQQILTTITHDRLENVSNLRKRIEGFSYIDDRGEIVEAKRPVQDGLAAVNLRDAFLFVEDLAFDERGFSKHDLMQIHQMVMRGEDDYSPGSYRTDNVKISQTTFVPPDFTQVTNLIEQMFERFSSDEFNSASPLIQATEAHVWFVSIHPFSDGNGRVARLLANYFLWRGYCVGINLVSENRERYYDALEWCNTKEVSTRGDMSDLAAIFCDAFEDSLEEAKVIGISDYDKSPEVESKEEQGGEGVKATSISDTKFDSLLRQLSSKGARSNVENSYESWNNHFSSVLSEIKNKVIKLDQTLKQDFKGGAVIHDYPIINKETYISICRHEKFSRTWYFKLILDYSGKREELIFYFGAASGQAKYFDKKFRSCCSLLISRYDREKLQHIKAMESDWASIVEIIYDGETIHILKKDSDSDQLILLDSKDLSVDTWFTEILGDLLRPALH